MRWRTAWLLSGALMLLWCAFVEWVGPGRRIEPQPAIVQAAFYAWCQLVFAGMIYLRYNPRWPPPRTD